MKSIPGAFYSEVAASVPFRGQTKTHEYLLVYVHSESTIIYELEKELGKSIQKDSISEFSERDA